MKSIIVKLILVVICIFIVVAILVYGLNNLIPSLIGLTPEMREKIRIDSISAFDKICSDINDNLNTTVYYINYVRIEEEFFKDRYYIDFEVKEDSYSEKMLLKTKDKDEIVKSCDLLGSYELSDFTQKILKDTKTLNFRVRNYAIRGEFGSGECAFDTISRQIIFIELDKVELDDYVVKAKVDFCDNLEQVLSFNCVYEGSGIISCTNFKEELKQVVLYLTYKGKPTKKDSEVEMSYKEFKVFFDEGESFDALTLYIYSVFIDDTGEAVLNDKGEKLENFYEVPIKTTEVS